MFLFSSFVYSFYTLNLVFFFFFIFFFLFSFYVLFMSFCYYNDFSKLFVFFVFCCFLVSFFLYSSDFDFVLCDGLFIYSSRYSFFSSFLFFFLFVYFVFSSFFVSVSRLFVIESFFLVSLVVFFFSLFFVVNDFFLLYLCVEVVTLSTYILCALNFKSRFSIEAGLKYFIIGSFSSCFLLYGLSFLYGFFGTLSIADLMLIFSAGDFLDPVYHFLFIFSFLFIFFGFFFKMYIGPFHLWIADIYDYSPTFITFLLATFPSFSFFYVLFNLYSITSFSFFYVLFMFFGLVSSLVGSLGGLFQLSLKRLLAYSSITNFGFLLFVLFFYFFDTSLLFWFYLVSYFVSLFIWFFFLLFMFKYNKHRSSFFIYISDVLGLIYINRYVCIIYSFIILSIVGIPPFIGFFAKFLLFFYYFNNSLFIPLLVLMLCSLIALFYYLRIISYFFYYSYDDRYLYCFNYGFSTYVASWLFFFFLMFFIFPDYFYVLLNVVQFI